jgi:pyridoxine 4-dehydrogenase
MMRGDGAFPQRNFGLPAAGIIRHMTSAVVSAAAAGTWQLGDLAVNRLGFGAMRVTGRAPFDPACAPSDRAQAIGVLRRAVELGVNHIDTAAFYFSPLRSANELINTALSPYPADLVITTKVGPGRDPSGRWIDMARPDQLRGQVEENLRQLGRDYLDVVNLRKLPSVTSIAEHFGALAELREAGMIRHLGISAVHSGHLAEAQAIAPVVCVQNPYSVGAKPETHAFLRECGAAGVAFVPFFSIAGRGRDGGPAGPEAEAPGAAQIEAIAGRHGASTAQVRLAWALAQGPHVLAIPGTGNPDHLAENIAAAAIRLSEAERALLESVA